MNDNLLKICVAPTDIIWGDKEKNLKEFEKLFEKIHPETDLLILPETFSTGFPSDKDKSVFNELAETNSGETIGIIKKYSAEHNFAIAGSFLAETDGILYNRAFFIEPSGDEYFADKKHLFSLGGENKVLNPGNRRMNIRYRGWNISMIICYDIRFPAWCRNKDLEYDILIDVANWPMSRVDTWQTLLKARALENEAYVCGVNCKAIDNTGCEYNGSSFLYNYRGMDLLVNVSDDGLLYASLSLKKLNEFREKFPFWRDADKFSFD